MQRPGQTADAPSPTIIFEHLTAYQRSSALRAAVEVGVFAEIGKEAGDARGLAKRCGTSERGMRILCDFLTIMGLLKKEGGSYSHTRESALFLDPASPACLASTALFLGNPMLHEPFRQLAEIVRQGRTVLPGEGSVEPDNPAWVEFAQSMAPMMRAVAGPFASIVLKDMSGPLKVLDIAAGHGLFGIEIAKQHPEAQIVAVDWSAVLDVARANAVEAGVDSRFKGLAGSAFDTEFGGPYDVALLTNFLHHFDRSTCVGLLRKIHGALKSGGRVACLEFVPNEDRVSPPVPASFSMMMLASTAAGDAYTFSEFESMYRDAGFENITSHAVLPGPETAVIGVKP